jgi:hypothetical protein
MRTRQLQVKLVKVSPPETEAAHPTTPKNSPESIALEVAKEVSKYAACLIVACKITDTLSQVAMHIAETKIK